MRAPRGPVVVGWAILVAACVPSAPPQLTLNRDRLDFGEVEVGGTYRLGVALTNPGSATLSVTQVGLEPPSAELELEGLPLEEIAAGNRGVLTVVYRPTGEAPLSALLRVEAADGQGPREVPVTGQAVRLDAVVQLKPGPGCALDFGTVLSGDAGVREFTLESTGSGTIAVLKASVSPEDAGFTIEGLGDGLSLPRGQRGAFTVRYDPTRAGPQRGAVTLETSSFLLPRLEIPLCGTGLVSAVCATPAALSLGGVAPGASATGRLTVTSCGNLPVTLESARIVADPTAEAGFSLDPAPQLPLALTPGQSTVLAVRFDSTSTRTARSQVRLTSSSAVTPTVWVATGANLPPPCTATLAPTSLRFYKDLAPMQSVRLTNEGVTDCLIERLDIVPAGSEFALERELEFPAVLSARSSMELGVKYAPPSTSRTPTTATLQVELDWVHEVPLRGDPRPPPGCHLLPERPVLDFGLISGGGPVTRSLELTNVGADACGVQGITFDQLGFSAVLPSMWIAAQSRTSLAVSATAEASLVAATMTLSSNDRDHPHLAVPIITGHVRCDPSCACTAQQTPTYWRFSDQPYVASGLSPATSELGAFQESCDPKRCADRQVAVEVDRGVLQCVPEPPTCPAGQALEVQQGEGWGCVPCALIVQYGGLFGGQRACAPIPALTCSSGTVPTFDAKGRTWRCVATCNNGAYDQRRLADGTLVCVPC